MKQIIYRISWFLSLSPLPLLAADVVWNNNNGRAPGGDRSWGNPANWLGGSPADPDSGNALIKTWPDASQAPVVDTEGNKANRIYLDEGAGLTVVDGGRLESEAVVLGAWGDSGTVEVRGGTLKAGEILLGQGGHGGSLIISGGHVVAGLLSIKNGMEAKLIIGSNGKFTAPESNLDNINYWISHKLIVASEDAAEASVQVDTTSSPGDVILTSVAP
jgi:hypothetical protein